MDGVFQIISRDLGFLGLLRIIIALLAVYNSSSIVVNDRFTVVQNIELSILRKSQLTQGN